MNYDRAAALTGALERRLTEALSAEESGVTRRGVLGGWLGSPAYSPTLGVFFLSIGVGAIVQVNWELAGHVRTAGGRLGTPTNLLASLAGFGIMSATDFLVAV